MNPSLPVFALPSLVPSEELADGTAVVIDVLRASTTIIHALEAGAREVVACLEVQEARDLAARLAPGEAVLGGERGGLRIEGFDLGNSPTEYTPECVGNKTVVLTTTNGTRAIRACRPARRTLIGAFVNASALCGELMGEERICLVCAGTDGQYSRDDVLLAGLLVERLCRQGGLIYDLNAQAVTARENWLASFSVPEALDVPSLAPERLAEQLRTSAGGKNLVAIGLEEDILAAAQIDQFVGVPELVEGPAGQMRIRMG